MAAIIAEPNVRLMTDVECRAVRLYKMRLMFLAGGAYTSAELAEHFNVTPVTIRKDLNDLCEQRVLRRIHGGALFPSGIENVEYESGA